MEIELVNAEQLTLDFSATNAGPEKGIHVASNVHSLDQLRRTKLDKSLESAYREIFESVKHVKLRPKADGEDESLLG